MINTKLPSISHRFQVTANYNDDDDDDDDSDMMVLNIQVAVNAGVYEILDNLEFSEFDSSPDDMKSRRGRWRAPHGSTLPPRSSFT